MSESKQGEMIMPEIKLTLAEKRAVFDWTKKRRDGVIDASKGILKGFLAKERSERTKMNGALATDVENLWDNVVGCFQGNGNNTPLLVVNNRLITQFKPNILPTHSEYHVSKVLTLSTKLFDTILPEEIQTEENALAVSLAAIIHDIGSLLKDSETGPQEKMYKFHELRAISLVDDIVDKLYEGRQGDTQQLKNKIKMLIAATIPKWNLDFSQAKKPTISKLLDPKQDPPVTLNEVKKDLFLNPDPSDDQETVKMKKLLFKQTNNLFGTFEALRKSNDDKAIIEMRELTHLMGAADHGAYMLEPSNMAEVFGLWHEQQTVWKGADEKLTHRMFSPNAETAYTWLTSPFTDAQWREFGDLVRRLETNPFAPDLSINRSKEIADHVRSILRDSKSSEDALLRVEGAFSPVELDNLAGKLGLEKDEEVKNAIIIFSHSFAHQFSEPHNFDALSTNVLTRMYNRVDDKSVFFKEVFEAIIDDSIPELTQDGSLNIHIAPFAYCDDISSFAGQISKAYTDLSEEKKKRIGSVFFTLREKKDDVDSIKNFTSHSQSPSGLPFGFALGGNPKEARIITELIHTAGKNIKTVVHFGLETEYEVMERRLDSLLNYMDEIFKDDLLPYISIHIDDKYEYFNNYLIRHPERWMS